MLEIVKHVFMFWLQNLASKELNHIPGNGGGGGGDICYQVMHG